jgi:lysophospholipase L1-like esterase
MVTARIALAPVSVAGGPLRWPIWSEARWALSVWVLSIVLLGSLAASGAGARTAKPQPPPVTLTSPVTKGSQYLALGDSVTFGYQEPTVVPAPNYRNASSFLGYPEQLAAELHLRVINPACPGETSASLINASAQSNGCENGPIAYRKLYPLHLRYKGSQLAYAVSFLRSHPQVKLVSLMIGANDLFLCQAKTKDGCTSSAEQQAVFTKVAGNVRRILSAVRNQAHYRGQLAIVNYYSLNYAVALLSNASRGLNRAVDEGAKPFGVVIADGYGEFQTASRRSAQNPCTAGLLTQLSIGGCGVHPTYAGQALLAQALLKAIRL